MMSVGAGHGATFASGRVSLGSWGQLEVSGVSHAMLETSSGYVAELPSSFARNAATTVFWLDEAGGLLLLIPRIDEVILKVDVRNETILELEWLIRDEDEDLRFASISPGPCGTLLVLYERGLVCIEANGDIRWHAMHDDLSAEIVAVDEDHVVLRQQWPQELAGRERRYSLRSVELTA
jgi:hypothetical protein